jgi:hypothetical protein
MALLRRDRAVSHEIVLSREGFSRPMEISQGPIRKIRYRSVTKFHASVCCIAFVFRGAHHCPVPFVSSGNGTRKQ